MADNPYEKLIRMMQEQGATNNSAEVQTAVMTGPKSCKVGELPLSGSDLLIAEHLTKPVLTKLEIEISEEVTPTTGTKHTHKWTDKSEYIEPLKAGDVVAITRLSDDQYAILGRLV